MFFEWYLVLMLVMLNGQPRSPQFIKVDSEAECMESVKLFLDKQKIPEGYSGVIAGCGKRTPESEREVDKGGKPPFSPKDNNPFHPPEEP